MRSASGVTPELSQQLELLLYSFCLGVGLRILYEPLRFLQCMSSSRRHELWESVGDLLYWCICGILMCGFIFYHNDGMMRTHVLLAILLGELCYHYGIGDKLMEFATNWIKKCMIYIRKALTRKKE